ncbi:winged helix-turn-helix domain-containing protein [Streptomyces sp. NPDC090036]|uniref:winged helix-turn-helix domain-containing protein n=1 Tax=Streptomyces sp. NPDC090036 TaxID=3365926 RepID=UPI00382F3BAC
MEDLSDLAQHRLPELLPRPGRQLSGLHGQRADHPVLLVRQRTHPLAVELPVRTAQLGAEAQQCLGLVRVGAGQQVHRPYGLGRPAQSADRGRGGGVLLPAGPGHGGVAGGGEVRRLQPVQLEGRRIHVHVHVVHVRVHTGHPAPRRGRGPRRHVASCACLRTDGASDNHQTGIRGLGDCDADLRDGPALTEWLAEHGLTGSREAQAELAAEEAVAERRRARCQLFAGSGADSVVMVYPALHDPVDAAALWAPRADARRVDAPVPPALSALLGRTRAVVLCVIADRPASTTTQLARRAGISPAGASEHATTLRAAGLTALARERKAALHTLTHLGLTLLNSTGCADRRWPV